ncbi:sulfite exporter TauE/SafE family protein [Aliikangiella sp. IMCC44359]|uniref:sulfite exporter TauE/SafE family protein n=1 Tax=Aliikangiella sp. IMCC44359 TaxID=3459125 RepID=UPI00403A96A1
MEIWLIFILAGLTAGFLAGLLGIGGGFVVVPVLVWALPLAGIPQNEVVHSAIGTSLLCICITALSSTKAHHNKHAVDWRLFKVIVPGLIIGSILGAALASLLNSTVLITIFVSGALLTACYLLSGHTPKAHPNQNQWPYVSYGVLTGTISSLIGIGGGSVLVPFLIYRGKKVVQAVGTAAACGFPIALFGAIGYGFSGWKQVETAYASGYLYWPAFAGIVIFSSLSAPWGAKVAHFIAEKRLKQLFALFLFFTSGQILYSHWS